MPCCGMKAHWIVGTIINISGLMFFIFGFYLPLFAVIQLHTEFGMWRITYPSDNSGNVLVYDIAEKPFYGMSSAFWRPAEGLGSAGIALNIYGIVLFQIFQFGNAHRMLPVSVCFVLAGSILTTAATVLFQHNTEMYDADYMVNTSFSLFFCVIGSFFFLVSGFVLMASTMRKIKKSRKLNGK